MNFKCKSCDAVMVFDPEKQALKCPFCDSIGTEQKKGDDSMSVCPSCGGELTPGEFTSADKCPYCGNFLIYDKRVEGEYKPDRIISFKKSKKQAVEAMQQEFASRIFTPRDFLSEKTLVSMQGYYVPFFMYDYDVDSVYEGEGTKETKHWREGNYRCTETSTYLLKRHFKASYDNVPADASIAMPDGLMDLIEPYDYSLLTDFDPKVLSGFLAEIYNMPATEVEPRAREKTHKSASSITMGSMSGYSLSKPVKDMLSSTLKETEFALFPVWKYTYRHGGRDFDFYVNGQSGKVVGKTPISKLKVLLYGLATAGMWTLILSAISSFFLM